MNHVDASNSIGISPRARPHVHSSPPTVTMPADLVDKIYIGYNAPYALGNMLAPQCVPAPIVSARNIRTTNCRIPTRPVILLD